jgi:hypothetical protein
MTSFSRYPQERPPTSMIMMLRWGERFSGFTASVLEDRASEATPRLRQGAQAHCASSDLSSGCPDGLRTRP